MAESTQAMNIQLQRRSETVINWIWTKRCILHPEVSIFDNDDDDDELMMMMMMMMMIRMS